MDPRSSYYFRGGFCTYVYSLRSRTRKELDGASTRGLVHHMCGEIAAIVEPLVSQET
jgi:hypothetical protein